MNRTFKPDWLVILIYLLLVSFGITNIYSSTFDANQPELFNLSRSIGKQLVFFFASIAAGAFVMAAPVKLFERFASIIYLVVILLLIGLYPFGSTISGARSWYAFGGVSLQPAEFAKVAVSLATAKLLSEIQINLRRFNSLMQIVLIIGLPVLLILVQPDAGSALVFGAFIFVLFREGLPTPYILITAGLIFFFILTLVAPLPFVYVSICFVIISLYFFSKKVNKKAPFLPYLMSIVLSCG